MRLAAPIILWLFGGLFSAKAFSLFDDQYYPHKSLGVLMKHVRGGTPGTKGVPRDSAVKAWEYRVKEVEALSASVLTVEESRALIHWAREQEWFESSTPLHRRVFDQAVSYVESSEDFEDLGRHITQLRSRNIQIKMLWVGTPLQVSDAYRKQWGEIYGLPLHVIMCPRGEVFPQRFLKRSAQGPSALLWMYATPRVQDCTRWFLYMKQQGHYARGFSAEPYFYTPKAWREGRVSSLAMTVSILDTLKHIVTFHAQYVRWRATL